MAQRKNTPENTIDYDELRSRYTDHDQNYLLLSGEKQGVIGEEWESDYVREKILEWTNDLIMVLDGRDPDAQHVHGDPEVAARRPDTVIWLDKSARPVSWLVDAFWDQLAEPGKEKPEYAFLNFEREDWFARIGKTKQDYIDGDRSKFKPELLEEDEILRIRAIFTNQDLDEQNWREKMRAETDLFANQHLLVVDEVRATGGASLDIALGVLKRAFPKATFSTRYFWQDGQDSAITVGAGERQMKSSPVWYNPGTVKGRGIGDTDETFYERQYAEAETVEARSRAFRELLGAHALSAPLSGFDLLTAQLQQDIAYLTYAYSSGRLFLGTDVDVDDESVYDNVYKKQGLSPQQGAAYRRARRARAVHKKQS